MNYSEYLYSSETNEIIGAAIEVQRVIGCGFTEPIYQEALEKEFQLRGIPYEREKIYQVHYKGILWDKQFRADFVCYDDIIVELKAVSELLSEHRAQLFNYMRITNTKFGILINFGEPQRPHAEKYMFNELSNKFDR